MRNLNIPSSMMDGEIPDKPPAALIGVRRIDTHVNSPDRRDVAAGFESKTPLRDSEVFGLSKANTLLLGEYGIVAGVVGSLATDSRGSGGEVT